MNLLTDEDRRVRVVNRFYRPALLYGGIIIATEVALFLFEGGLSFGAALAAFGATVLFCGIIVGIGMQAVRAFVEGLEAGGLDLQITHDEIGWWGGYRLRFRVPEGLFRVESVIGPVLHIRYNGPTTFGWQWISLHGARRAGREEAGRVLSTRDEQAVS